MKTSELIEKWKKGMIENGLYQSYCLENDTNIIVEVEEECITLKFLENKFTRCETYHKDGTIEEWFE